MFNITNNIMQITRGDSAVFEIEVYDADDKQYTLQEGDLLEFTVKKNTKASEALIHKIGSLIELYPEDTKDLKYGNYVYDVQLTFASGSVDTIITPTAFAILEEVTF